MVPSGSRLQVIITILMISIDKWCLNLKTFKYFTCVGTPVTKGWSFSFSEQKYESLSNIQTTFLPHFWHCRKKLSLFLNRDIGINNFQGTRGYFGVSCPCNVQDSIFEKGIQTLRQLVWDYRCSRYHLLMPPASHLKGNLFRVGISGVFFHTSWIRFFSKNYHI